MQGQNSGPSRERTIRPPVESETQLPVERAFVVQLSVDAVPGEGRWCGRAEHVVSGQVTHFDTIEGLLAFVDRVLAAAGRPARTKGRRGERRRTGR